VIEVAQNVETFNNDCGFGHAEIHFASSSEGLDQQIEL
jgi:hypothetical protein